MDKPIFGYWIDYPDGIYFVRDHRDALPCHKHFLEEPIEGVQVTPVTRYQDIAHYVVLFHTKMNQYIYTGWTPGIHRELEQDHTGKFTIEVLAFVESKEEAEAAVQELKDKKPRNKEVQS